MSDDTKQNGTTPGADTQVRMQVLAQFVRDFSFENAVAQKGAPEGDVNPEISVQVSLDARKREQENQYEVISKYRVTSTNKEGGQPLFIIELDYGGIFQISGVPEDQLHPFLMIECPRLLFPFTRRLISDITRDGGFPPFNMDPIDFVALYRQELARRTQQQASTEIPN